MHLYEVEEGIKKLSEMKEELTCMLKNATIGIDASGMDTMTAGAVTDMIKDLAEAEKACMEACYYKTVIKAMEERDEEGEESGERSGYNNCRYSSGRYAPAGRGHISGYPMYDRKFQEMYDYTDYMDGMNPMMGYGNSNSGGNRGGSGSGSGSRSNSGSDNYGYSSGGGNRGGNSGSSSNSGENRSQSGSRYGYGKNYDNYRDSRMGYNETHSPQDKEQMNMHAKNHVMEAMDSIKEIWRNSDDIELKKKIKADMSAAIGDMTV